MPGGDGNDRGKRWKGCDSRIFKSNNETMGYINDICPACVCVCDCGLNNFNVHMFL